MANEPIRRDAFEIYRDSVRDRFDRLEQEIRDLKQQHEDDMNDLESKGRWTWQKITAAVGTAAALLGLWYQALSSR